MANTFFISDTHFGHANILGFKRPDGTPVRDFNSVEEMNEHMVERWNSVVQTQDKVYHLGDAVFPRHALSFIKRLNGHKRLVMGNHDMFGIRDYLAAGFEDVYGVKVMGDSILTHMPTILGERERFKFNIHGHTHATEVGDPAYINVSVEAINYTPISLDDILVIKAKRLEAMA